MKNDITLYGHYDSGHVYKVALFLALANVEHQYEHVDIWAPREQRQANFRQHSRNQEVPCLVMQGVSFIQSNVILQKLARDLSCFGGESDARLLSALDWQFWEANRLGMCLPQLRYARAFAPDEFTNDALAFLQSRFDSDIAHLAAAFEDGRQFILDDQPSIADFSACGYLYWADEAQVNLPQAVADWLGRISSIQGWQAPYELLPGKGQAR